MSHVFTLTPDYKLLLENGYGSIVEDEQFEFVMSELNGKAILWESDNFDTKEERVKIETGFKKIVADYHIEEHYQTLLYVALAEYDQAWLNLDIIWENQSSKLRAKELAQLLLLRRSNTKNKSIEIVLKSHTETVKVKDKLLSDWILNQVKEAFETGEFPIGMFGDEVAKLYNGDDTPFDFETKPIDVNRLETAANLKVKSFNVIRRRYFTAFTLNLCRFLNATTTLKAAPNKNFSDMQLCFLFDVAVLFSWIIDEDEIESPKADYMSSLLTNYLKH